MAEGSRSGSPQLPKQRNRGLKVPRHHADVLILAMTARTSRQWCQLKNIGHLASPSISVWQRSS